MKIYKTILMVLALIGAFTAHAQDYDVVLKGGRVMDPETSLDAVMNVGIKDGKIAAVTTDELTGKEIIDVKGLVVSPGFHRHPPAQPRHCRWPTCGAGRRHHPHGV
jgi:formylmethanofuran dehydrogenase subunit A